MKTSNMLSIQETIGEIKAYPCMEHWLQASSYWNWYHLSYHPVKFDILPVMFLVTRTHVNHTDCVSVLCPNGNKALKLVVELKSN